MVVKDNFLLNYIFYQLFKLKSAKIYTEVISNWEHTRDCRVPARNFGLKFLKSFSALSYINITF